MSVFTDIEIAVIESLDKSFSPTIIKRYINDSRSSTDEQCTTKQIKEHLNPPKKKKDRREHPAKPQHKRGYTDEFFNPFTDGGQHYFF